MEFRYHNEVDIDLQKTSLKGDLVIPSNAEGIVIFSHGSGSSRFSPRNRMVADYLHKNNLATLLFDLLTEQEDQYYYNRFNIDLLTERLVETTLWVRDFGPCNGLKKGYFGASTGAASALQSAATLGSIKAIVSRGGRPDLAMESIAKVKAPTLLIVGSLDHEVLRLNKEAYAAMKCRKQLEVIEGASHLFEEKGMMERVCEIANDWFKMYLEPARISFNH